MEPETCRALNALNRAFYEARGADFDASRDHPWPGWTRALASLERAETAPSSDRVSARGAETAPKADPAGNGQPTAAPRRVLDVGCGNGRFGAWLAHRTTRPTHYLGLDASSALLESARTTLRSSPPHFEAELREIDFLDAPGPEALPEGPFDLVVVFGVLHHVPGDALRRRLVVSLADRLAAHGGLVLTAWQFGGRDRFARSLVPDDVVAARAAEWGFEPDDLEPGDHFLGFGGESAVPRYCHAIDEAGFEALTTDLGLTTVDAYAADGKSGDLNLYRVLSKSPS